MDPRGNPHQQRQQQQQQQQHYVVPPSYQYQYPHAYMNYQLAPNSQAYAMTPPMQQLYSPQGDMMYHQQYYQFAATSSMPNYYMPQNMPMNYNNIPKPNTIYAQPVYNKATKFDNTNKSNNKAAEAIIHYCEMCDKEMNSLSAYDAHCASHESCTVPGCDFKASKRVVQAHFHSVHGQYQGSGYKTIDIEGQKFCVLMGTDVKEVEQWREERRKKFPTAIKQMLRDEVKDQLLEAGGILPQSDKNLGKRTKIINDKNPRKKNKPPDSKSDEVIPKFPAGEGRQNDDDNINTEESSSHPVGKICNYYLKGKCRRGNSCTYLHDSNLKKESSLDTTGEKKPNSNKLIVPKPLAGGERGTLLKKLLEDEIMAEDNVVLQCLRYFVKNEYFDNIV